jgi:CRP-like cAMP-binding protein
MPPLLSRKAERARFEKQRPRRPEMRRSSDRARRYQEVDLLAGCPAEDLDRFDAASTRLTVSPGTCLLRQGAVGRQWLVLAEGEVVLSRGGVDVAVVGGGESLGELALLDGVPQPLTATARTPVTCWVLHHGEFFSLLRDSPTLRAKVIAVAADHRRLAPSALEPAEVA